MDYKKAGVDIEAGYKSLNLGSWIAVKDVIPRVWEVHNYQPHHQLDWWSKVASVECR